VWEKVKGAARLAWIIVQIISIPMAVVGTLFLTGVLPRKHKPASSGNHGSGVDKIGGNLDDAGKRKSDIAGISDRFGSLIAEGKRILSDIRARNGLEAGSDDKQP
jgi:hypothetical protein